MELRVLRYLVAVVDAGSLSKAAGQVHVAQPSLSRQLRNLERELGIELFRRGAGGRLLLSSAGQQLLPVIRDVLVRADHIRHAAEAITEGRVSRLTVVAPPVTISDVIAPYLAEGCPDDPVVDLREDTVRAATPALRRGADVVILSGVPSRENAWQAIARLPLFAYTAATHRWAGEQTIGVEELVKEQLAVLTPQHGTRRLLDAAVADAGVSYTHLIECESPQVAQALAAAGRAVAVVSDDNRFGLHQLLIEGGAGTLQIALHAEWSEGHFATNTIRALLGRITEYCERRYGPAVRPAPLPRRGKPG